MGSRNLILGSGGTSYPAYLVPWVPLFGIFSLWWPATSVKTNGYPRKLIKMCVCMSPIELTLFEFYFLRYSPLTGTSWCSYGDIRIIYLTVIYCLFIYDSIMYFCLHISHLYTTNYIRSIKYSALYPMIYTIRKNMFK